MTLDLSRCLHALTIRADRAADRILHAEHGISYSRFLALYAVGEAGAASQRAVAEWLGVTEPSVSRMVQVLAGEGWLVLEEPSTGGNRRSLRLTEAGARIVADYGQLLEQRFADLVEQAGVSYTQYRADTLRLLAALGGEEPVRTSTPAGSVPRVQEDQK